MDKGRMTIEETNYRWPGNFDIADWMYRDYA
jgi:hypothetical protein